MTFTPDKPRSQNDPEKVHASVGAGGKKAAALKAHGDKEFVKAAKEAGLSPEDAHKLTSMFR